MRDLNDSLFKKVLAVCLCDQVYDICDFAVAYKELEQLPADVIKVLHKALVTVLKDEDTHDIVVEFYKNYKPGIKLRMGFDALVYNKKEHGWNLVNKTTNEVRCGTDEDLTEIYKWVKALHDQYYVDEDNVMKSRKFSKLMTLSFCSQLAKSNYFYQMNIWEKKALAHVFHTFQCVYPEEYELAYPPYWSDEKYMFKPVEIFGWGHYPMRYARNAGKNELLFDGEIIDNMFPYHCWNHYILPYDKAEHDAAIRIHENGFRYIVEYEDGYYYLDMSDPWFTYEDALFMKPGTSKVDLDRSELLLNGLPETRRTIMRGILSYFGYFDDGRIVRQRYAKIPNFPVVHPIDKDDVFLRTLDDLVPLESED